VLVVLRRCAHNGYLVFTLFSAAVQSWFLRNNLQLNANKSESIILSSASQLQSAASIQAVDVAGSRLQTALKLKSLSATIDSHPRFECYTKDIAMVCNYHTCPMQSADRRPHSGSGLQPRHFQAGLLQCHTVRCTSHNLRHTAITAEQPGQTSLSAWMSHRCQFAPPVAPLVASQKTCHVKDGAADAQGVIVLDASIPEQPDPDGCSCPAPTVI